MTRGTQYRECRRCERLLTRDSFRRDPGGGWCNQCRRQVYGKAKGRRGILRAGLNYRRRDENLARLGFASYAEYLSSRLWRDVRARAFRVRGGKCVVCGVEATEIHHARYGLPDLRGDRFKHLHPVCRGCHVATEFDPRQRKRTMRASVEAFEGMRGRRAELSKCVIRQ